MEINGMKVNINSEMFQVEYDKETNNLSIDTLFSPKIIDSNFNQLEMMFENMQKDINKLKVQTQKLENKINILEAINKK